MGVPLMLVIAVLAPALWVVAAGWLMGIAALMLLDAVLGAPLKGFESKLKPPALLYIDSEETLPLHLRFTHGSLPSRVEVQLETNELVENIPARGLKGWDGRERQYEFTLIPNRRGQASLVRLWSRWKGPLGLIYKQHVDHLNIDIPVTPNVRWVKDEAVRLFSRDAEFGIKTQIERGDGSEFDALREFTTGMDRRAIDWKHSARHRQLLAKEFRTERNHNIVFAFDTGRLMSEPLGGVPKIDRAINAALLLTYVSLRGGDRTMFYSFDARPGISSGFLTGARAFPKAQAAAARLDYSSEETNFTLALSELSQKLERRSLIIIFSDFVDTISAELMVENVKRLSDRHLVVFATFEDAALASMINQAPEVSDDVSRAVIAGSLLAERDIVFKRLRRLGVQIIETTPEAFGGALISRYLQIKRREML